MEIWVAGSNGLCSNGSSGAVKTAGPRQVIVSAHSGGYRPAAFALELGGLARTNGRLHATYTDHLQQEHLDFEKAAAAEVRKRISFTRTAVDQDQVIQRFFSDRPAGLDKSWRREGD